MRQVIHESTAPKPAAKAGGGAKTARPEARSRAAEAHVGKTLDRKLKLGGRRFPGPLGRGASVICLSILDLHGVQVWHLDCWFGRGLCMGIRFG